MLTQNLASGLKRGHGRRLAKAGATAKLIMCQFLVAPHSGRER